MKAHEGVLPPHQLIASTGVRFGNTEVFMFGLCPQSLCLPVDFIRLFSYTINIDLLLWLFGSLGYEMHKVGAPFPDQENCRTE